MRIRDRKNSDPGSGMEKFRTEIRDKHPGYAALKQSLVMTLGTHVNCLIGAGRIVLSDEESESQWQRNDYKETKKICFYFYFLCIFDIKNGILISKRLKITYCQMQCW